LLENGILEGVEVRRSYEIVKNLKVQEFIDTANILYPGFTEKLKTTYKELDDREICICCLILFGFNNEELDILTSTMRHPKNRRRTSAKIWQTTEALQAGASLLAP